jgi:hypothetical protein
MVIGCWLLGFGNEPTTDTDEKLIGEDLLQRGRSLVDHAVRLINGYIRYLTRAGDEG